MCGVLLCCVECWRFDAFPVLVCVVAFRSASFRFASVRTRAFRILWFALVWFRLMVPFILFCVCFVSSNSALVCLRWFVLCCGALCCLAVPCLVPCLNCFVLFRIVVRFGSFCSRLFEFGLCLCWLVLTCLPSVLSVMLFVFLLLALTLCLCLLLFSIP